MPAKYQGDFVGAAVPPVVKQRVVGPPFPGATVVSFRFPHRKVDGEAVGFYTLQTRADAGVFGKKED